MAIHLLGPSGAGDPPFSRTFFNTTLGELVSRDPKVRSRRVTLYLVDGATMDVCSIDSLSDAYLTLRVYNKDGDACSTSLHLIPYGVIYRIEVALSEESEPVGFRWTPGRS
ncbi:MAG: hypothetical protein HYY16_16955 [Planctomycetes bacterium]|nr:hypothetical protein [Planctomycetota bacterium]